jgi:hypothetical protein
MFENMKSELEEIKSHQRSVGTQGSFLAYFKWDLKFHASNFDLFLHHHLDPTFKIYLFW